MAKPSKVSNADLQYAEEVLEVFRLGDTPLPPHATPSMRKLYEWVGNPENYDTFVKTMVTKATDIVAKHRQPEERGAVVIAEKKGIAELQEFLRQNIEESQKGRTSEQPRTDTTWVNREKPSTLHPSIQSRVNRPNQIGWQGPRSGDWHDPVEQSGADSLG